MVAVKDAAMGAKQVDPKEDGALLVDRPGEGSLADSDELRPLLDSGRERGFVTFEELVRSLEEIDVTKEQLGEFRGYLTEQGIDLLSPEGKPMSPNAADGDGREDSGAPAKKVEIDLTVEPSLDS